MNDPAQTTTFVDSLLASAAAAPESAALITDDLIVTHADLDAQVTALARSWDLPARSLVALGGERSARFVIAYLAVLRAGHVPVLIAPAHTADVANTWSAAALLRPDESGYVLERFDTEPAALHPDLAVLLSTSGSTGSPKLVRLSHRNLRANAEAIAEYLRLGPTDRAMTTLPLHYCYGLSVLHSHLVAGASIVVTDASVVDPCCRSAIDRHQVTNLAGVPHTFELLERTDFSPGAHPTLRFLTQAGGRMPAARVRRWADDCARHGVELFVMYGQTEATARMAYLPPSAAARLPHCIGNAIPGGTLSLRPHPAAQGPHEGELVYSGPNVMMGYATHLDDLADGATLAELATGDLARYHPADDVYELIGRASRFVKPFGVRVDLDRVQELLDERGHDAAVAGDDDRLVVAGVGIDPATVRREVATLAGLPEGAVRAHRVDALPRTLSGKLDLGAVNAIADAAAPARPSGVAAVYRTVLGRSDVGPSDTFVSLGGDSLSYVECSLQLEGVLPSLPSDWHLRTVAELSAITATGGRARLDTTVVLRAVCICAVVATHMRLRRVPGGAHTLLAVVGYNFARFQLSLDSGARRLRSGLRAAARVAVPTSLWIAANMLLVGGYSLGAVLLVNDYVGDSARTDGRWRYWFFESFVQIMVISTVLMSFHAVARLERRAPFLFALALTAPLLVLRFEWLQFGHDYNYLYRTHTVAWCFALGWLVYRATTVVERMIVTVVVVAVVDDFFHQWYRERFVIVALLVLLWLPSLPIPRLLHRPISVVAAASMWIFLIHWQLFPTLDRWFVRELAYALTLSAGVAVWWVVARVQRTFFSISHPKGTTP